MRRKRGSRSLGQAPSTSPSSDRDLSERINRLFAMSRHPDEPQREYRNREVVEACRSAGRDISESHLSELRRGVKINPSARTLETLAWFFHVPRQYFTDATVASQVEVELAVRHSKLMARLQADREARADLAAAARELQQAIRVSGVTRMAHRGTSTGMDARQQAAMMRALTAIILADNTDQADAEAPARDTD